MRHLACLLLACVCAPQAVAGLLRLESETLSSLRRGENQKVESPNYEFLGANYTTDARDIDVNADIGVYGDPNSGRSSFDLYLLNASYKAVPDQLTLYAGRSFDVQHSVRAAYMDTAGVDYAFSDKRFKLGAFAGRERKVELRDHGPTAELGGIYGRYQSSSVYPLLVKATLISRRYSRLGAKAEPVAGLSAQKTLARAWSPELMFTSESQLASGRLNRLEAGVDLYPSLHGAVRLRALTYEANADEGIEQPLFSIFAEGRLYEVAGQLERRWSRALSTSIALAFDDYLVSRSSGERSRGVKTEADVQWTWERLTLDGAVYYLHSYGGEAVGSRLLLSQSVFDRLQVNGGVEITHYKKITSAARMAYSSMAGATWRLRDHFRVTALAELNSNNIVKYEWRAMAKLVYVLWAEK